MNSSSIFLKLNIFFMLSFLLLSLLGIVFINHESERAKQLMLQRALDAFRIVLRESNFEETLKENYFSIVTFKDTPKEEILISKSSSFGDVSVVQIKNQTLYKIKKDDTTYIKDEISKSSNNTLYYSLFLIFGVILVVLYLLIYKNLKPLKKLKDEITAYGMGKKDIDLDAKGKDEISEISKAFLKSVEKIEQTKEARELFLRNVMHELKTPITKGRISISLLEKNQKTKILESVFEKLEKIIDDMAHIEALKSQNLEINIKPNSFEDILENCIDMLMAERDSIDSKVTSLLVDVDFRLFSLVVKNLIDNALKYSPDKRVKIYKKDNLIIFENLGERIEDFQKALKPFSSANREQSSGGMGLGLYITKEILKIHGFGIEYQRVEDKNLISINLQKS